MTWASRATRRQPFPTVRFSSAPTGTSTASRRTKIRVFGVAANPGQRVFSQDSPDVNATERLWHYTRKESTHNRYFDRPAALCQSLFATFADMQGHPEKRWGLLVPFFKSTHVVLFIRGQSSRPTPIRFRRPRQNRTPRRR